MTPLTLKPICAFIPAVLVTLTLGSVVTCSAGYVVPNSDAADSSVANAGEQSPVFARPSDAVIFDPIATPLLPDSDLTSMPSILNSPSVHQPADILPLILPFDESAPTSSQQILESIQPQPTHLQFSAAEILVSHQPSDIAPFEEHPVSAGNSPITALLVSQNGIMGLSAALISLAFWGYRTFHGR